MEKTELNEILTSLVEETTNYKIPTKLASQNKKNDSRRCKVHKYIRFNANNKTMNTTKYYCVNCPSRIDFDMILGRMTECWKCGEAFTVSIGHFANKPLCENCKGKSKHKVFLKPSDEMISNQIQKTKTEILDMIMKKVGL